jgi:hypothetical protein
MAIAVGAVGAVASGTGDITPGLPAGWAPGWIHVLVVETSNELLPFMSGWLNVGAGSISLATGTVTALVVRWRRAMDGDTDPTVPDSGDHQIARIIGFTGCAATGDPWNVALFATENISDTTVGFPNPSTTVANTMIVHVFSTGQDTNTAQSSGAGTNAGLTGLTSRMNNWTNAGSGGGFAMITGAKASTGAIGVTTTTLTTANVKALFTGALTPAGTPTVPVVSIGEDSWCVVGGTFGRVAVENDTGSAITAREWKVISGPADAGNVVGTEVANTWAPSVTGSYVIRYTATNGVGASFDELNLEVGGAIEGPQNSITNVSRR